MKLSPRELDTWSLEEIVRVNALLDMQDDIEAAERGREAAHRAARDMS